MIEWNGEDPKECAWAQREMEGWRMNNTQQLLDRLHLNRMVCDYGTDQILKWIAEAMVKLQTPELSPGTRTDPRR